MSANELVLVDLSSIAYPIYLTTQADPDPNKASQQIVARVRQLASDHPHAAICCDSGRSFRHDLAPRVVGADGAVSGYKANRPEREAALHHQIALAIELLQADGFPVWSVKGFEADDIIATATKRALDIPDTTVLIVSSDKDLLQLVNDRVRAKSARDGAIFDPAAVEAKFGVTPTQLRDYLTLVGDASDNVKGANGIGAAKAKQLLATFKTLDKAYAEIANGDAKVPAAVQSSLLEFRPRMEMTRALVTLRTDVTFPFEEIAADRTPRDLAFTPMEDEFADDPAAKPEPLTVTGPTLVQPVSADAPAAASPAAESGTGMVRAVQGEIVPADYERQLDPRSMKDARVLAEDMFKSRMFTAYGSPQAVLSTVMVGRELGLPAMASLRSIHNIEDRHALSASLMVALVIKSGLAEYFEPVSFSDSEATFETHRKGARKPVILTHTIEMARQAWPKGKSTDPKQVAQWEGAFLASGWGRNPTDMLVARATSRLARMVYPDLLAGLYTPEELAEIREQKQGAA